MLYNKKRDEIAFPVVFSPSSCKKSFFHYLLNTNALHQKYLARKKKACGLSVCLHNRYYDNRKR